MALDPKGEIGKALEQRKAEESGKLSEWKCQSWGWKTICDGEILVLEPSGILISRE